MSLVARLWAARGAVVAAAAAAVVLGLGRRRRAGNAARVPTARAPGSVSAEELRALDDDSVVAAVVARRVGHYALEKMLGDHARAVRIRRRAVATWMGRGFDELPHVGYDYAAVDGVCAENVVGYVPVPVGVAGPLRVDGAEFMVPMATTEGALIASTNRGCKAISVSGGCRTQVVGNGMTRAPCVRFETAARAAEFARWLEVPANVAKVGAEFAKGSSVARLLDVKVTLAGRMAFVRFRAFTGDAMGMNMVSKGCEQALKMLAVAAFPDLEVVSISGNACVDKKPSATNWIDGRGKSVVAEAVIEASVVEKVLKTTVPALAELGVRKNLVGSAMAGSIGGFNAHAANMVAAVFLATGQDMAQVVESASCITLAEPTDAGDLFVSVTMPCIEVGTVGGGTALAPQAAALELLGVRGSSPPGHLGEHAETLARVIAATVLAGELSLMSALAAGHLVKSHMKHNRKKK